MLYREEKKFNRQLGYTNERLEELRDKKRD